MFPIEKLGFGCGRIVGGANLKHSAVILESAYKLGIRHFDLAPSYGLGTAEDAIGAVFDGDKSVRLATKVGITRPTGAKGLSILRKYLAPILKSSNTLKSLALKSLSSQSKRGIFDQESVEISFNESLKRLRRTNIDYFLLHEPQNHNISPELTTYCEGLIQDKIATRIGLGFNFRCDGEIPNFGTVLQNNIGNIFKHREPVSKHNIVHGVFRSGISQIENNLNYHSDMYLKIMALKIDLNIQTNLAGLALALTALNDSYDLMLVSYSDIARMSSTLRVADKIYQALR